MDPLAALGPARVVDLPQGTVRYRDLGPAGAAGSAAGPPLVFVHGVLVNGALWRAVAPTLADRFRCVVPDLPLGAHLHPLRPEADRSPGGVARLLLDFVDALALRDVVLVGNDTGGAVCQIALAARPERFAGLVLTNCDAYEAFFPPALRPFAWGARAFGDRFGGALARLLRRRPAQRALLKLVARRRFDDAALDASYGPFLNDPAARADLVRFLANVSNRDTIAAAAAFPRFRRPVLIAWAENDPVFPAALARRLQRDFPDARLTFVPRSRAFVPEDQPALLADLIARFAPACAAAPPEEIPVGATAAPVGAAA
jgi:pimeloyl-ACP methyl ester carboxylesterase